MSGLFRELYWDDQDQFTGNILIFVRCTVLPSSGTINNTLLHQLDRGSIIFAKIRCGFLLSIWSFVPRSNCNDAIAVVIINLPTGITGNTTATDSSPQALSTSIGDVF